MKLKQNLSIEEIDELAQALSASVGDAKPRTESVRAYDFGHPDKHSKSNLRALQMVFANLESSWAGSISSVLRCEASVKVNPVQQVSYASYSRSLPTFRLVWSLSANPLVGEIYIDMPIALALSIVDRMTGGTGEVANEFRMPSKTEQNILNCFISRLAADISKAWKPVANVQTSISGIFTSLDGLELARNSQMLVAGTVWDIGFADHCVNIALEANSLDPIIDSLEPQRWLKAESTSSEVSPESMTGLLKAVDMPVSVQLGRARVRLRDVLNMEAGDVVRLDNTVRDSLDVKVAGRVRFQGRPGLTGKKISVQIVNQAAGTSNAMDANPAPATLNQE